MIPCAEHLLVVSLPSFLTSATQGKIEKTKAALEQEAAMAFGAALDAEAKVQATLMGTPDFREAYEAFVARRPPRFA